MPDKHGPAHALGQKLRRLGIPSLTALRAQFEGIEDYPIFINLVREFLPDRESDILGMATPGDQIATFATHFESCYFPLHPYIQLGDVEGYADLTRYIRVRVASVSYDAYHEIAGEWDLGFQLMTYLVKNPDEDDDAHIALADACSKDIPATILEKVPTGGLAPSELEQTLKDTPYKALIHWANILHWSTGNFFLDVPDEDLYSGMELPEWDRETVEGLTQEWQEAKAIMAEANKFADWIEEKPRARFEEILNFILERRCHDAGASNDLSVGSTRGS